MLRVVRQVPHPQYNAQTNNNDLMLLQLERPARLGRSVRPIAVARSCASPGTSCRVSGWGTTSSPAGEDSTPALWRGGGRGPGLLGPAGGQTPVVTPQCSPSQLPQLPAVREHQHLLGPGVPAGVFQSHHRRHDLCRGPGRWKGLLSGEVQAERWRRGVGVGDLGTKGPQEQER